MCKNCCILVEVRLDIFDKGHVDHYDSYPPQPQAIRVPCGCKCRREPFTDKSVLIGARVAKRNPRTAGGCSKCHHFIYQ